MPENKKSIKIGFHSKVSELQKSIILSFFDIVYEPVVADDYDYYFFSETIYYTENAMDEIYKCRKNAIRFFFCGEALYPDFNIADYVITFFDIDIKNNERIFYLPFVKLLDKSINYKDLNKKKFQCNTYDILGAKNKFCNFIYGNANAIAIRDEIFYAISKYKQVDSLGRHLNNVEITNTREHADWQQISVELKKPYKFSIAVENSVLPGYTTEKILTSMLSNTIPIYFGNPNVSNMYNDKSFINVSDFDTLDDLVKYVKEVDECDDLYCKIMREPWMTDLQINKLENDIEKFYITFNHLFELPLKDIKRRGEGIYFDTVLPKFYCNKENHDIGIKKQFINYLKKIINK